MCATDSTLRYKLNNSGHKTTTPATLIEERAGVSDFRLKAGEIVVNQSPLSHSRYLDGQTRFGGVVFGLQLVDIITGRQDRFDRTNALPRAPNILPGLGVAATKIHR